MLKLEKKIKQLSQFIQNKRNTNKKGFTLIELIIVIAIIGILVAAAMMNMGHNTEDARIARAKEDVRNLLSASILYYNDHGEVPKSCEELINKTDRDGNPVSYIKVCPKGPWNGDVADYKITGTTAEDIKVTIKGPDGSYTVINSDDLSTAKEAKETKS